jgi:PTS system mannose-specific IIC component
MELAILILLAGLWSMDRSTAFNFMISRPVVVSATIGALCGNFSWCIMGGMLFEIVGLMDLPMGTRISKDDTFGAFFYAYVIANMPTVTVGYSVFIMVIAYLLIYPSTYSIVFTRWLNKKLYQHMPAQEGFLIWSGQAISFVRGVVVYLGVAVLASYFVNHSAGLLVLPHVGFLVLVALFCFFTGYFAGFFTATVRLKIGLLLLGGAFAWLIL